MHVPGRGDVRRARAPGCVADRGRWAATTAPRSGAGGRGHGPAVDGGPTEAVLAGAGHRARPAPRARSRCGRANAARDKLFTVADPPADLPDRLLALRNGERRELVDRHRPAGRGAVLLVAVWRCASRPGPACPASLVYLLLGMAIGESGLGIQFENVELTRVLGFCALVLIIAEGGLTTRWPRCGRCIGAAGDARHGRRLRQRRRWSAWLLHLLLGLSWQLALLYGAVLSSTDAAAVFSTLRRLHIRPRLTAILEAESGINDAPAVLLVIALSQLAGAGAPRAVVAAGAAGRSTSWSAGARDRAGRRRRRRVGLRRVALPAAGLYPLAAVGLHRAGVRRRGGRARVGLPGRVRGRGGARQRPDPAPAGGARLRRRAGLAGPDRAVRAARAARLAGPAARRGAARAGGRASCWCCWPGRSRSRPVRARWFRIGWREQAFLSWAGLRGAVPIVLATIPLSLGVPGADGSSTSSSCWSWSTPSLQGGTHRPGGPAAAGHRAGRADRAAGGDGAAGPDAGRPAASWTIPDGLAAGRRLHRRAAAAAGRGGHPGAARRRRASCRTRGPGCGPATAC